MKKTITTILLSTLLLSCNKMSIKHNPEIQSIIQSDSVQVESIKSEIQELKYEISVRDSQIVDLTSKYERCLSGVQKSEKNSTKLNILISLIISLILFFIIKFIINIKNKSK